jgi:hypothetical protein
MLDPGHRTFESVVAQQQVVRQITRRHRIDHRLGATHRVARLVTGGFAQRSPAGDGRLTMQPDR